MFKQTTISINFDSNDCSSSRPKLDLTALLRLNRTNQEQYDTKSSGYDSELYHKINAADHTNTSTTHTYRTDLKNTNIQISANDYNQSSAKPKNLSYTDLESTIWQKLLIFEKNHDSFMNKKRDFETFNK